MAKIYIIPSRSFSNSLKLEVCAECRSADKHFQEWEFLLMRKINRFVFSEQREKTKEFVFFGMCSVPPAWGKVLLIYKGKDFGLEFDSLENLLQPTYSVTNCRLERRNLIHFLCLHVRQGKEREARVTVVFSMQSEVQVWGGVGGRGILRTTRYCAQK